MKNNLHTELREEFENWYLPTKERNYPSMFEITEWWLSKIDELTHDTLEELIEKCGNGYKGMWKILSEPIEYACPLDDFVPGETMRVVRGNTPEEAAQNLLEALTKHHGNK